MLDKTVSRTLPDLAVSKILSLHQPHAKIYIPGNDMRLSHAVHSQQVQ